MTPTNLTFPDFVSWLNKMSSQPIWKVAHLADGLLYFYLGEKTSLTGTDMMGKPVEIELGEYVLHLDGDWVYTEPSGTTLTRLPLPDEQRPDYFQKIEAFAQSFPATEVESVKAADKNQVEITFATGAKLLLSPTRAGFLSLQKNPSEKNPEAWEVGDADHNSTVFELWAEK